MSCQANGTDSSFRPECSAYLTIFFGLSGYRLESHRPVHFPKLTSLNFDNRCKPVVNPTHAPASQSLCANICLASRVHDSRTPGSQSFAGVVAEVSGELNEYVTPSPPGIPTPPAVDLIDDACRLRRSGQRAAAGPRSQAAIRFAGGSRDRNRACKLGEHRSSDRPRRGRSGGAIAGSRRRRGGRARCVVSRLTRAGRRPGADRFAGQWSCPACLLHAYCDEPSLKSPRMRITRHLPPDPCNAACWLASPACPA